MRSHAPSSVREKDRSRTDSAVVGPQRSHTLHELQHVIGNQGVLRLMRAQSDGGRAGSEAREGNCASQVAVSAKSAPVIQAKLAVNSPGDVHEQEADRVSAQVMGMAEPQTAASTLSRAGGGVQRKCACGGTCAECKGEQSGDKHERGQMKPAGPGSAGAIEAPAVVHEALRSPGQPLDATSRAFMEPRFGHDFNQVRVHNDLQAARSAKALHARAYTVGRDVAFAERQYAPSTPQGQALLAHELTHVVQQGAQQVGTIQRSPDDAGVQATQPATQPTTQPATQPATPPSPAPPAPAVAAPPTTVLDPDANEAAERATRPDLPKIDRTLQKSKENDEAAQGLVMMAFGGPHGVNATFETKLSPIVRTMVDHYFDVDLKKAIKAGQSPDADDMKTANRAQFLGRMRIYFKSWAEVVDHFSKIEKVGVPADPKAKKDPDPQYSTVDMLYLHRDARVRFERAAMVLKSKGHALPAIGEGFSIRGYHRGEIQHKGYMIHAMGYAFDVSAKENPKIARAKPRQGLERHDPHQIAVSMNPEQARMDLGPKNKDFIEKMGKRTAANLTLSAADDRDPATVEYFQRFEQQFHKLEAGSAFFTKSTSKVNRDKLLKLRSDYFDVLKAQAAERKKPKSDAKVMADLEAKRRQLLGGIPALTTEWIAAIDHEISDVFKKHPGMEKLRPPSDISRDLKSKAGEIETTKKDQNRAQAGQARAAAAQDAATKAVARAKQRLKEQDKAEAADRRSPNPAGDWQAERPSTRKLKQKRSALEDELVEAVMKDLRAQDALQEATKKLTDLQSALAGATSTRGALASELKKSDTKELHGPWGWIAMLRELRQALKSPDLTTPAAVKAFERLTTGDLTELGRGAPVDNPPLLRLLEIGFFNPKGAFDLAFFEEMAHSGFMPGATWGFGDTDPMHFELVEGRDFLQTPGKDMSNF